MLNFGLTILLLALTCGFMVTGMMLGARWITQLITSAVNKATETQNIVMLNSLEGITGMLKDAVISGVSATTQAVMVSLVGDANTPVPQPSIPPEEDLSNPEWTRWNDGDPDAQMADIGDSVMFRRPDKDSMRVAGIEEGESIIPGVPVPDMTGEGWQPWD